MNDSISRQAAIDEIKALYEWHDTITEDRTIDHLKRLPSAQPELTENWWKTDHGYMWLCPHCGLPVHSDFEECLRCGIKRPSAQPEQKCETCRYRNLEWSEEPCDSCTIGGKDCHYKPERKKGKWIVRIRDNRAYFICSECGDEVDICGYGFCPNCGADMRGEE